MMMGIQGPRECPRQPNDRRDGHRDGQAADEQDTSRSTIHRRIPMFLRARGQVLLMSLVALVI